MSPQGNTALKRSRKRLVGLLKFR